MKISETFLDCLGGLHKQIKSPTFSPSLISKLILVSNEYQTLLVVGFPLFEANYSLNKASVGEI